MALWIIMIEWTVVLLCQIILSQNNLNCWLRICNKCHDLHTHYSINSAINSVD